MNDKMKILKMLEEGSISAEDAARLLELSNKTQSGASTRNENNSNNNSYNQSSSTKPTFDEFTNNIGKKFEVLMHDLEPTFKNIGEVVVEKTNYAAEKFSQAFSSTSTSESKRPPEHPRSTNNTGGQSLEKKYNLPITSDSNILNLTALNSNIVLKGYNGDKITATVHYVPCNGNPNIELVTLGNKFFLDYSEDNFKNVGIEAYIPEKLFKNLDISAFNSNIKISNITTEFLNIYSTNGNITIENLHADNVKIQAENGKSIDFVNVSAKNALLESYNGNIKALNLDIATLDIMTNNGSIEVMNSSFNRYTDYMWIIETSNKNLKLNLPCNSDVGYFVKAEAPLGEVRIGLTGLSYIKNDPTNVEAKSVNFDSISKKVKLKLETSNSKLQVN